MSDDQARGEARCARIIFGEGMRTALENSLVRVGCDAREFAVSQCVFGFIGAGVGGVCALVTADEVPDLRWLVVIDAGAPSDLETLVAHEVAHAFLDDDGAFVGLGREEIEARTRALVLEWGFIGPGADEPT